MMSKSEWTESKTAIWTKLGTRINKKDVFDRIDHLVASQFLESRTVKNRKQYRRKDSADTHLEFIQIMKNFEVNQKTELERIKKLKTITKVNGKLSKAGKELLDHVQDEVDRAYIVMVRMNYQAQLNVMTKRSANERSKKLQEHIDKTMKMLTRKYPADLVKEYFQNHIKNLQFKV